MNTLGKRIAIAREKLGLNQSELARQIDVTPQAVQKWEMDNSKPKNSNWLKFRLLQLFVVIFTTFSLQLKIVLLYLLPYQPVWSNTK